MPRFAPRAFVASGSGRKQAAPQETIPAARGEGSAQARWREAVRPTARHTTIFPPRYGERTEESHRSPPTSSAAPAVSAVILRRCTPVRRSAGQVPPRARATPPPARVRAARSASRSANRALLQW